MKSKRFWLPDLPVYWALVCIIDAFVSFANLLFSTAAFIIWIYEFPCLAGCCLSTDPARPSEEATVPVPCRMTAPMRLQLYHRWSPGLYFRDASRTRLWTGILSGETPSGQGSNLLLRCIWLVKPCPFNAFFKLHVDITPVYSKAHGYPTGISREQKSVSPIL